MQQFLFRFTVIMWRKERETISKDISVAFLICDTAASVCNICVYHFDIAFHILCV